MISENSMGSGPTINDIMESYTIVIPAKVIKSIKITFTDFSLLNFIPNPINTIAKQSRKFSIPAALNDSELKVPITIFNTLNINNPMKDLIKTPLLFNIAAYFLT